MSLIIPTVFFFLLNFSFAQIDIKQEFDDLNSLSEANNVYYNSLNYQRETCEGTKGYYNDTCYSTENPLSIYTFVPFNDGISPSSCGTNQIFTELDEDKNLLSTPQCANKIFDFTISGPYTPSDYEGQDLSIRYNDEYLYTFTTEEYDYYNYSCLKGKFERACDFLANLYALSLYSNNNIEVQIIDKLDDLLHENFIL